MSMNREQKRMLQRQGQLDEKGNPVAPSREDAAARMQASRQRQKLGMFARFIKWLGDVWAERKKVVWPSRAETIMYTTIVIITLIVVVSYILVLDFGFAKGAGFLFK